MKSWRDYWYDLTTMALIINPLGKRVEENIIMIQQKIGGNK